MVLADITSADWRLIRRHCGAIDINKSTGFVLSNKASVAVRFAKNEETFELLYDKTVYPESEWPSVAMTDDDDEEDDDGREWPDTDEEPTLDDLARLSDRIDRDLSHGYISNTNINDLAYLGGLLRARIEELQREGGAP